MAVVNNFFDSHNDYTGWSWFVKRMDELWEERQDFKVYTTLADMDRPYSERVKIHSREEYLNFIRSMHMGVGCFQKYSAWSISTTDGLSQGVPYVLPNGMCYPEMVGKNYPLLYDGIKGFKSTIEHMLDDPIVREEANKYLMPKLNEFKWSERVPKWFGGWKFLDKFEEIGDKSESYKKILDYIKRKKEQQELLKTTPMQLKPYYKKKVNAYFNSLMELITIFDELMQPAAKKI